MATPIGSSPAPATDQSDANWIQPVEMQELGPSEAARLGYLRYSMPVSVVLSVAYSVVFLVGLVGNSFVVAIVCKSPRMRTVTNYFIANLALADILVLLFCLPATLASNLFIPYVLGRFVCKAVSFLQGTVVSASINTMVTVTLDRFLAICFPMDWHMSRRMARWVIASIWLFSITISAPWAVFFNLLPYYDQQNRTIAVCMEKWPSDEWESIYFICANLILLYLFPATVIILCYLGIWYKIERRNIPGDRPQGLKIELIMQKSKLKVVKMMTIAVIIFLISWLPLYLIVARVKLVTNRSLTEDWVITQAMPLAQWLGASNSCINPILYTIFNRKYRRGFIELFRLTFCCRPLKRARTSSTYQFASANETQGRCLADFNSTYATTYATSHAHSKATAQSHSANHSNHAAAATTTTTTLSTTNNILNPNSNAVCAFTTRSSKNLHQTICEPCDHSAAINQKVASSSQLQLECCQRRRRRHHQHPAAAAAGGNSSCDGNVDVTSQEQVLGKDSRRCRSWCFLYLPGRGTTRAGKSCSDIPATGLEVLLQPTQIYLPASGDGLSRAQDAGAQDDGKTSDGRDLTPQTPEPRSSSSPDDRAKGDADPAVGLRQETRLTTSLARAPEPEQTEHSASQSAPPPPPPKSEELTQARENRRLSESQQQQQQHRHHHHHRRRRHRHEHHDHNHRHHNCTHNDPQQPDQTHLQHHSHSHSHSQHHHHHHHHNQHHRHRRHHHHHHHHDQGRRRAKSTTGQDECQESRREEARCRADSMLLVGRPAASQLLARSSGNIERIVEDSRVTEPNDEPKADCSCCQYSGSEICESTQAQLGASCTLVTISADPLPGSERQRRRSSPRDRACCIVAAPESRRLTIPTAAAAAAAVDAFDLKLRQCEQSAKRRSVCSPANAHRTMTKAINMRDNDKTAPSAPSSARPPQSSPTSTPPPPRARHH